MLELGICFAEEISNEVFNKINDIILNEANIKSLIYELSDGLLCSYLKDPFFLKSIPLKFKNLEQLHLSINEKIEERISLNLIDQYENYIKDSQTLSKLTLSIRPNYRLMRKILQALLFNHSIQRLNLSYEKMNYFLDDLMKVIKENKTIQELDLTDCDLKISEKFAYALLENLNLKKLILFSNTIDEKAISIMVKSKIENIYIDKFYLKNLGEELTKEIQISNIRTKF